MAATVQVGVTVDVSGLGSGINVKDIFEDGTAPEVAIHVDTQVQETADTAEALNVGAIDTIRGVLIRAVDGDINIDTSYVSSFNAEILVREGQNAFFCPTGIVYIKNATALETVTFEFVAWGLQT